MPIFSCPDSHIICSTCVPKLRSQECPQCRRSVKVPDTLKRDTLRTSTDTLRRDRFAESDTLRTPKDTLRTPTDTLRRDRFAEKTAREYEELLKRLAKLTGPSSSLNTKLTELDPHEEPPKPKLGDTEYGNEENKADADGKEDEGGAWSEGQRGDFGTLIFENTVKIRPLLFRKSKTPKYSH